MLNSERQHEEQPYIAWFDFDIFEKTIPDVVEEMLRVDGHETIYAIGGRNPQRHHHVAKAQRISELASKSESLDKRIWKKYQKT